MSEAQLLMIVENAIRRAVNRCEREEGYATRGDSMWGIPVVAIAKDVVREFRHLLVTP